MGLPEIPDAAAAHRFYLEQFKDDALNVHTVHAETEGMGQLEMFTALLRALEGARRGIRAPRRGGLEPRCFSELPVCPVIRSTLPGRAGWISAQGEAGSHRISKPKIRGLAEEDRAGASDPSFGRGGVLRKRVDIAKASLQWR